MGNFIVSDTKKALPKQSLNDVFKVAYSDLEIILVLKEFHLDFVASD